MRGSVRSPPCRSCTSPRRPSGRGRCRRAPGRRSGRRRAGGGKAEVGVPGRVADQADGEAPAAHRGGVPGGRERDGPVVLARGDESVEGGVGVCPDAEDEVQPALPVGQRHREREVAPVVNDDVALAGMVQMGEGGLALVFVVEQVEVDREAVVQPVEDADHAPGIVGAVVREAVAVLGQLPGQGDLRAVDGEDPVTLPEPSLGTGGEDLPVQPLERGLVELLARLAGRRRSRRLALRQLDAGRRALLPELAQRGAVALPARRDDEAEHEEHDQQAVEHAAALLPARVLARRDGGGGRDERLPAPVEAAVAGRRAAPLGPRRRLRGLAALAAQDIPGALAQRLKVDALARLSPAGRLPDALPVGRPVARGPEAGLVDEGLAQHRAPAVEALPVVGEPPRRQGQRRGRQVFRAHPGKHQEARVDDHQAPPAVARPALPADPAIPAREPLGHRIEQQASQPAAVPVGHKVEDVRPEGASVAEVVVAVDQGAPQPPSLAVGDRLDAKRTQLGQRRNDRRLGVGGRGPGRRRRHISDVALPLRRQRQDAVDLQRLQHPETGPNPAVALRRRPAEMLADRLGQLVAAVVGQQRHGLLDVGDLLTVQAAARKVLDSRAMIRWSMGDPQSFQTTACISRAACQGPC